MKILISIAAFLVTLVSLFAIYIFLQIPSQSEIKGCLVTKMYHVSLCPGSKNYVPLRNISTYLQKAIVMSEDSGFFQHQGFEWDAIEKNAQESWKTGKFKRGGSTISQQLVKNMFLTKEKTLLRKGIEALITVKLESTLTKKEILERYLNVIEFGKNIYGIGAASQFYFKKSPAQLNIPESAFLAMILPNPIKYSNSFFKKQLSPFAKNRINRIVGDLYRYQRISEEEYNIAMNDFSNFFGPQLTLEEDKNVQTELLKQENIEDFAEEE